MSNPLEGPAHVAIREAAQAYSRATREQGLAAMQQTEVARDATLALMGTVNAETKREHSMSSAEKEAKAGDAYRVAKLAVLDKTCARIEASAELVIAVLAIGGSIGGDLLYLGTEER